MRSSCKLNLLLVLILGLVLMVSPGVLQAQEGGGDDARSQAQNPVSAMYSLPLKFTVDFGAPNGSAYFLNIQPVLPVTVGDLNLVSRIIAPIISVEGLYVGSPELPAGAPGPGATGLGDINYSLYFSPVKYDKVIWGAGPSIMLPTATDDQLGSGKWSGGITAVALTQPKWGTYGGIVRQLWSFAGDSNRQDVNSFLLEPFVNYNLDNGWYLLSDLIMTANWDAPSSERWTIPLGGGAGKIFKIGNQLMNTRLEAYYNVESPKAGPDWSMTFTLQFLFPRS